jgi:mRNA interferase MazF
MASSDTVLAFDVVLVPFPFSDRMAEKRRPALVISKPDLVTRHGHVWLAMITSARQERWESDVHIDDTALAGLPVPSVIRTAKIATTDVSRIIRVLGRLDARTAAVVRERLFNHLG